MKKLYEKSEITFTIVWIVVYCVLQSVANPLNKIIGIEGAANAVFNVVMTVVLFNFIRKNGLLEKYGLCKTTVPARKFLYYVPLFILATSNLWFGIAVNLPLIDTVCYLIYMLCVGFIEEVLFRGFLFKAMAKDNIKSAIIISSVTFGLGHLLHLINGSGVELIPNLCQVIRAIAIGYLFVVIFYRGGSLLPCIITHSAIDMISAFANETGLTVEKRIDHNLILIALILAYALILTKVLPKNRNDTGDR